LSLPSNGSENMLVRTVEDLLGSVDPESVQMEFLNPVSNIS
jgi:hypothetical protein